MSDDKDKVDVHGMHKSIRDCLENAMRPDTRFQEFLDRLEGGSEYLGLFIPQLKSLFPGISPLQPRDFESWAEDNRGGHLSRKALVLVKEYRESLKPRYTRGQLKYALAILSGRLLLQDQMWDALVEGLGKDLLCGGRPSEYGLKGICEDIVYGLITGDAILVSDAQKGKTE